MATIERSKLHVEGNDDAHTIKHLLNQHGCVCLVKGENPSHNVSANSPEIVPVGSDTGLLDGMEINVRVSSGRAVGFVLDADEFGRKHYFRHDTDVAIAFVRWFKRVFRCG